MLDGQHGRLVKLDVPFQVSPSGGGMCVLSEEGYGRDAFVVLVGYASPGWNADTPQATALVTISGVVQVVFG